MDYLLNPIALDLAGGMQVNLPSAMTVAFNHAAIIEDCKC